jgi:hypothetical protein
VLLLMCLVVVIQLVQFVNNFFLVLQPCGKLRSILRSGYRIQGSVCDNVDGDLDDKPQHECSGQGVDDDCDGEF